MRAPISTTGMQVSSRLLLVWGIVNNFPFLAKSAGYSSMLIAWSVTEVIRYSYFVVNLSGYQPAFITWLRYNTFYVLYPMGISSECWLIYKAIEPAKEIRREYAWILQAILLIYIPGKSTAEGRCELQLMVSVCRLVYPLHTHDGAAEKGDEREAGTKGRVRMGGDRHKSCMFQKSGFAIPCFRPASFQRVALQLYISLNIITSPQLFSYCQRI